MRLPPTLRRTLSLHFLLVAVLPALTFGVIAIALLDNHLLSGIRERHRIITRNITAVTDRFLTEVETDLQSIGKVVDGELGQHPDVLNNFLASIVYTSKRFESIFLLDANRRVVGMGIDPHGIRGESGGLPIDVPGQTLFRQPPVVDRLTWSDPFLSPVSSAPSVTLTLPVKQGILLGNIRLDSLSQVLILASGGGANKCAIIDRNGTLIASSELLPDMQAVVSGLHQVVGRAARGTEGPVIEKHGDVTLLESAAILPRTGWVAWVGVDMGMEMAPLQYLRNILIGVLLLALLAAGGVALLNAQRLMLPLLDLRERAGEIGAGRYDRYFPSSGFAEIDSLAGSLQMMARAIRDREQSLVNSEQRFRDLVNSIDGVVWEMDVASGGYLFVSERSAAMFGYPASQWLDAPDFWARHVAPEDIERVVVRGRRSLAVNEKCNLEYRFITATGETVWVRDLVTVIWEANEPRRLLGVMIDITDRKQTEAELERYRTDLEELVTQRTWELQAAQGEVVRNERLAVLGQLTATVSHEIRNPLGTVANALFQIRETLGSDCLGRVERPLALAERGAERCDGIISELLDFTRQRELRREPVVLDTWLTNVLEEIAWPDDVQCRWHLASGVNVFADPERLRRAVVNVINNALQAMEETGEDKRTLAISTRRLADRCEIAVRDSGCGIPEEIRERIFEPLFSTKNFGVGLGVPIIRNIMTDHGGGVDYQSRVGEGTTVTLWLPLPPAAAPSAG